MHVQSIASPHWWAIFLAFTTVLFALDLGLFNRKASEPTFKQALGWLLVWVSSALIFCLALFIQFGQKPALEFLTGYVVEQSLSVDNIFVFLIIFSYFKVPSQYQRRVLFYGIVGAFIMRAVFIFVGTSLLQQFEWMGYVLGVVLLISGVKLLTNKMEDIQPEQNILVRLLKRAIPLTDTYEGEKFFVRRNGKLHGTPLCIVLGSIEVTDLVFAVDSIPAVIGITTDPFIVLTSNIFAILGLRSVFFVLNRALRKIEYLNVGLALVLVFVGLKMLFLEHYITTLQSLIVIVLVIGVSIGLSLLKARKTVGLT